MKNEWILDVLADLKNFAKANGLPALADQLADTADLAAIEIMSEDKKARTVNGSDASFGQHSAAIGNR